MHNSGMPHLPENCSMEKIDLAFKHFSLPPKANLLIEDCRAAGEEICAHGDDDDGIPQFVPADGRISWHLLNSVIEQTMPGSKPVFCEWGSGIGLVTLIASLIGLPATGIEIEEDLIEMANGFSKKHAITASFINGSIYPKDNPDPLINYAEVDLFFAYPWPNQITQMINLFQQVASSGAVFVCYHGGRNYRVLQC